MTRVPPPPPVPAALPPGRVRVDCHLHTVDSGDARMTIEELARRVAEVRLDVVCVTEHNQISGALKAIERDIGARVVVGEEVRTASGEIIGLFLTERIPYVLPVPEVIGRIRAQEGVVYAPHPHDPERSGLGAKLDALCAAGDVDVIEVFNAKNPDDRHNTMAAETARRYGLPGAAGSDAHDPEGVGAAYLEMPDFDGPKEFLAALPEARVIGEYRPHAPRFGGPGLR